MGNRGYTGLTRIIKATGYSISGLLAAFRHEAAFRQELILFIILTPVALWVGDNGMEYALLIGSLFLVLITELLNTAVEAAIDRIGVEEHKLSGRAKDVGSAAVFVAIANVIIVWFFIILK
jgi:diacylglycerol kinase (ATP)